MLSISNLQKSLGTRVLFDNVSFSLNAWQRYGLVGANGSGKSTFLKIIAGEEKATNGTIAINRGMKLGMLRQDQFLADEDVILHVAMKGQKEAAEALFEKDRIVLEPLTPANVDRIHHLEDTIARLDGYMLGSKAGEILEGLGIPSKQHLLTMSALSGGFKWRVLLAQVLISDPDILLLDEPTNHLDIVSIRWLEKFLSNYRGCALIISHDRRFLDNVCTDILDIDYETITVYPGNYEQFETMKKLRRDQLEAEIAGQEREIAHKKSFVDRFGAKASKARQAQSRMKQIEKIEVKELPRSSRRYPALSFMQKRPSGRDVLEAKHLSKAFGEKSVLVDVSVSMQRGNRIGIIGPNGVGKSTFLKILVDNVVADAGTFAWGHETYIGYFAQDHEALVRERKMTLEEWLWQYCPSESKGFVRSYLGRVLFSGSDAEKDVRYLSGGEVARLVLAKLMLEQPNVLILDEPTNHLDIEAVEAMVEGLKAYEGTLIFVSHDRWFVSQLATRILELKPQGYFDFPGDFAEYLSKCGDDHLDAQVAIRAAKKQKSETASDNAPQKLDRDQNKEQKAAKRKLIAERDTVLQQMAKLEKRQQEIQTLFADVAFYQRTPTGEMMKLQDEKNSIDEKIASLTTKWEELERQIG